MPPVDGPIVVFDGVCALCNGWVRFLLRHDRQAHYRFAAMQDPAGRTLMQANGLDPEEPRSFLLVEGAAVWQDSDGVIEVLRRLGGIWRIAAFARFLPLTLRDGAYRWVARHRYRMFGRHDSCLIRPPGMHDRFL